MKVLDIGPTSSTNINFLTGMGHGVWMADVVDESSRKEWELPPVEEGGQPGFNTDTFFEQNLNFSGREFDVVMLWTTLDYIPDALTAPLIDRLHKSLKPGGKVLALFHSKSVGPDTAFCRYHLTPTDAIEAQESGTYPIRRVYTNRNIEKLFAAYSNYRFFLAKDNVYEVIITR
ncbi:class I SAM-dependent methyltransferase [Acidipila rosea]|uniref:class I SAM-dependent methyltransferase n=1 Tax=Acidipila rosea TaxID=768535 RepID=UPI0024369BBD|nr:methyltransferase domain-containing protein [Acidipila rosea]